MASPRNKGSHFDIEPKKHSKNCRNSTSYKRSFSRHRGVCFKHNKGVKRQFATDIERTRYKQKCSLDNIRHHEGRMARDEFRRSHQTSDFMLDPSICSMDRPAELENYDVDHRQTGLSDEMGIADRQMYQSLKQSSYNMNEFEVNLSSSSMVMASTSTSMNFYPYGVSPDPSMYGPLAECSPMMNSTLPTLVPTELPNCVLVPPSSDVNALSRRDRPPGCRTVFVGGLSRAVNEQIIREVFSYCGEISRVKMSKRTHKPLFCHIWFEREEMVEQALTLSGYRLIVKEEFGSVDCRIHVDYAVAPDDKNDYESKMRALQNEEGHKAPSDPRIPYYSDREAANLVENLRERDTFEKGCMVLMTWLDRGDCNKNNYAKFYSLIQSTCSHANKLVAEKNVIEDELKAVKQKLLDQSASNAKQFNIIEKVLQNASLQKVWDQFTKPQRKQIEQWKLTLKQYIENLLEDRVEDEMEVSEDEKSSEEGMQDLVEPNESSSEKETQDLVKPNEDSSEEGMQDLVNPNGNQSEKNVELAEENEVLRNQLQLVNYELAESKKKNTALNNVIKAMHENYVDTTTKLEEALEDKMLLGHGTNVTRSTSITDHHEALLVSLISRFLNAFPGGASIAYICDYLSSMVKNISSWDIEIVLKKFSTVFKEESIGIGASLEKKWILRGFGFHSVSNQTPTFD